MLERSAVAVTVRPPVSLNSTVANVPDFFTKTPMKPLGMIDVLLVIITTRSLTKMSLQASWTPCASKRMWPLYLVSITTWLERGASSVFATATSSWCWYSWWVGVSHKLCSLTNAFQSGEGLHVFEGPPLSCCWLNIHTLTCTLCMKITPFLFWGGLWRISERQNISCYFVPPLNNWVYWNQLPPACLQFFSSCRVPVGRRANRDAIPRLPSNRLPRLGRPSWVGTRKTLPNTPDAPDLNREPCASVPVTLALNQNACIWMRCKKRIFCGKHDLCQFASISKHSFHTFLKHIIQTFHKLVRCHITAGW